MGLKIKVKAEEQAVVKNKPIECERKKINPMNRLKEKRKSSPKDLDSELEAKGVVIFKPTEMEGNLNIDSDYLTLPQDITEVTSQELGRYLNAYTQHRMYMRTLIGWQQLALEEAKRNYYDVSVPIYSTLNKKDFPSETSKERYINNHPEVVDYFYAFRDENRKLDLLYLNLSSIDDAIFLISREISRRTGDFNLEKRNDNVQRN